MTEAAITAWTAESTLNGRALEDLLRPHFTVSRTRPVNRALDCHDAHGYPLYYAGLCLVRQADTVELCRLGELGAGAPLARAELAAGSALPRFWWDFPDGELRIVLQPHLKLRALQPVATLHLRSQRFALKNADGKIVLRLQLDSYGTSAGRGSPFYQQLLVLPLRGYDAAHDQALRLLQEQLSLQGAGESPLSAWFAHHGAQPNAYSSKLKRKLRPEQPAREVMCTMIGDALALMVANEQGIIDDIDTEFLHDYRVALRKIRSLLSQLKGVLPDELSSQLRAELRELGQRTNRLRDLDVYLLEKDNYYGLLPPDLQPGLDAMFADYAAERRQQQARLARYLKSRAYRRQMDRLQALFADWQSLPPAAKAETPIIELARKNIRNKYRKVCRVGRGITPASPDEEVHQLRIDGKKLRYVLEFFAPLFPKKQISTLLRHLKDLQDALGRYNDLAVQQQSLRDYLAQHEGTASPALYLGIGALLGVLHREQRELHDQLAARFEAFDDDDTRQRFAALLGDAGSGP